MSGSASRLRPTAWTLRCGEPGSGSSVGVW